jgi:hypothetical protein
MNCQNLVEQLKVLEVAVNEVKCMAVEQRLADLTDEQLDEKITKLSRIVYSPNVNLARQAYPILLNLIEQQSMRNTKKFEEHVEKSGMKMDEIINIGN